MQYTFENVTSNHTISVSFLLGEVIRTLTIERENLIFPLITEVEMLTFARGSTLRFEIHETDRDGNPLMVIDSATIQINSLPPLQSNVVLATTGMTIMGDVATLIFTLPDIQGDYEVNFTVTLDGVVSKRKDAFSLI